MQNDNQPLVSIIIPCYNDGRYLHDLLSSIPDKLPFILEVILVDDGSTDPETLKILANIKRGDEFRVLQKENGGLSSARNLGIRHAQSALIFPVDADDKISGPFIEQAVRYFQENPQTDIVFADRMHFDGEDKRWVAQYDPVQQVYVNQLPASCMYRKCVWEEVGGYDEKMKKGYEDWDFWLGSMALGKNFYKLEGGISYFYRIRKDSMVRNTVSHHDDILQYIHQKHHNWIMKLYIQQRNEYWDFKNNYRKLLGALCQLIKHKIGLSQ